jgi:hypothetical protein
VLIWEKDTHLKIPIFWDMTLSSPRNLNRRFGETHNLYFFGRRVTEEEQHEANRKQILIYLVKSYLRAEGPLTNGRLSKL